MPNFSSFNTRLQRPVASCAFATNGRWLWAACCGALFLAPPALAQKVVEHKVWSTFHKTATAPIDGKYKSYSVEYDFGQPLLYAPAPPVLNGLEYKKTGGDLSLVIRQKNFAYRPGDVESHAILGGDTGGIFYSTSYYTGDIGYELLDKRTNAVLQRFQTTQGSERSRQFYYRWDLDLYLKGACADELSKKLLQSTRNRIDYTMVDHHWTVRLPVNLVEGEAPAYQEISKAATEFEKLMAAPALDKSKVLPLVATWEAQLAKADWPNKKAEINRKVANALLGNLCSAYLLLEDYSHLGARAEQYTKNNMGILEAMGNEDLPAITFNIDKAFTGPTYQVEELTRGNATADYYVVKYSGELAGPAK